MIKSVAIKICFQEKITAAQPVTGLKLLKTNPTNRRLKQLVAGKATWFLLGGCCRKRGGKHAKLVKNMVMPRT